MGFNWIVWYNTKRSRSHYASVSDYLMWWSLEADIVECLISLKDIDINNE